MREAAPIFASRKPYNDLPTGAHHLVKRVGVIQGGNYSDLEMHMKAARSDAGSLAS